MTHGSRRDPQDGDIAAIIAKIPGPWAIGSILAPLLVYYVTFRFAHLPLIMSALLSLATGAVSAIVGALRRELGPSVVGLAMLGLGVASVAGTGQARGYFLPGILLHIVYALAFLVSVLVRRPAAAILLNLLRRTSDRRQVSERRQRAYVTVTLVWVGKFAIEVTTLGSLYLFNDIDALTVAEIAVGWPLDLLLFTLSIWILRRSSVR